MYKVTAPNTAYNGKVADVQFNNGVAFTENARALNYFRSAGYKVEPASDVQATPEPVKPAAAPKKR